MTTELPAALGASEQLQGKEGAGGMHVFVATDAPAVDAGGAAPAAQQQEQQPAEDAMEEDEDSPEEASRGQADSDFVPSEEEEEEAAEEEEEKPESDPEFRLSDESDDWDDDRPRRRCRSTPAEGTRRSKRLRDAAPVAAPAAWEHLEEEEEEEEEEEPVERRAPRPMRGAALRSGLAIVPPGTEIPSLGTSAAPSKAGSPLPNGAAGGSAPEAAPKPEGIMSPVGVLVQRIKSGEEVAAEKKEIQSMWELAAIYDFLQLFRPQLRIRGSFGPDELEHCLVTSLGDSGLLADLHVDIMKGISPKSDVAPHNWQIHLGNKMKYHWKTPLEGADCPFKPDKYFEATSYAVLPSRDRVRALHYILCVRADREDVAARLFHAQAERSPEEVARLREEQERLARSRRPQDGPQLPLVETLEDFRRQPTGVDSQGRLYYYLALGDGQDLRLLRETPAPGADEPAQESEEAAAAAAAREHPAVVQASKTTNEPTWLQQERVAKRLGPPPPKGAWELVASSVGELEVLGVAFASSEHEGERSLAAVVQQQLLPRLQAQLEEEEKRLRAAERVQKKLGAEAVQLATAAVQPGGLDEFGRPRRERKQINYAFNDYDDMLKSAIRNSRESDGDAEGQRRRRRTSPPQRFDAVTKAQMGMRRGRSAAALKYVVSLAEERSPRQQMGASRTASRAGSRRASRSASAADLQQQQAAAAAAAAAAQAAAHAAAAAAGASAEPAAAVATEDAAGVPTRQQDQPATEAIEAKSPRGKRKQQVQYLDDDGNDSDAGGSEGEAVSEEWKPGHDGR